MNIWKRCYDFLNKIDARSKKRPLVITGKTDIRIEFGDISKILAKEKVAIVAGYSCAAKQPKSLCAYLSELTKAGFGVLLVSTSNAPESLQFSESISPEVVVARRPNVGYDFGSWAMALHTFPELAKKETVLLTNDSLVGPFSSIQDILSRISNADTDVVAATSSAQIKPHLQSFFLGFRHGILAEKELSLFFQRVRVEVSKQDVVIRNELALLETLNSLGYSYEVLYRADILGVGTDNPTLMGWRKLLEYGFPFVKATIIKNPETAPHGYDVARVVKELYAVDLDEWV